MLAAFLAVLADLDWPAVVGITALAWLIAATVEWLAWQPRSGLPSLRRYPAGSPAASPYAYAEPPREPPRDVRVLPADTAELPEQPPAPSLPKPEPEPPDEPVEEEPVPATKTESVPAGEGRRSWLGGLRRRSTEAEGGADDEPELPPEPTPPEERPPLRAVEPPEPEEPPAERPDLAETSVVRLASRRAPEPREWNLWDLESLAREEARADPSRRDEWSYLFLHLRQFADAQGTLPSDFDHLVRESFGDLLESHHMV